MTCISINICMLLYISKSKYNHWFLAKKNSQNDILPEKNVYSICVLNLNLRLLTNMNQMIIAISLWTHEPNWMYSSYKADSQINCCNIWKKFYCSKLILLQSFTVKNEICYSWESFIWLTHIDTILLLHYPNAWMNLFIYLSFLMSSEICKKYREY